MPWQRVSGGVRGGQQLDIELFEQRPRPEFVSPQTVVDMIVIGISGVGGQHFVNPEKMFEGMIKPDG